MHYHFPIDFNIGRPSAQFEAKFVELATTIAGREITISWDDTAFKRDEGADYTRAEMTYQAFLRDVFHVHGHLAEREARRLYERGEKVALFQVFRALITRRYPLPIDHLFDSFGLVVRDEATERTVRELHMADGFVEQGLVDTFGFEAPVLDKKDAPQGVPLRDARKALLYVAAGAEVIVSDNANLVVWLNERGVHTFLVSEDWMSLDFGPCGQSELEALVSLISPIGEAYGLTFHKAGQPGLYQEHRVRPVQPLVAWSGSTVRVYEGGWSQLCLAFCYALDATFEGNEKAQRRRFLGRIAETPIWDDSDVYTEDDPFRKDIVAVSARLVEQQLDHRGRMTVRSHQWFETADLLPRVRRVPGYANAIGHDQGAKIYLYGEALGMRVVTAEEAALLQLKGVTTKGGRLVEEGDAVLLTDKVNKVRKRHTLGAGTSFEPLDMEPSKLIPTFGEFQGVKIPVVICRTAISAQAGDAIVVNTPAWQRKVAHRVFHPLSGTAQCELKPVVEAGQHVERGQNLLVGDAVRVKAPKRGRVVHLSVVNTGDGWSWEVLLDEVRRGGDVKARALAVKVSCHLYPDAYNPWLNDRNPSRDALPMGLVVLQDGFKGELSHGLLQLICDTHGIGLGYDPVQHALGAYEHLFEYLPAMERAVVLRWVMTPEEQELWEAKGVTLGAGMVDDGADGFFELVLEAGVPVLYQYTTGLFGELVFKIEASGVEDAVGRGHMPLEVSYWLDAIGCPEAAQENFERGQDQFELLQRLHAMNLS